MTTYFLVINAEDGEHIHRFTSGAAMDAEWERQVGRPRAEGSVRTVDDFGRVIRIETWAGYINLKDRKGYGAAYDARECGTLTAAQARLLHRIEGDMMELEERAQAREQRAR